MLGMRGESAPEKVARCQIVQAGSYESAELGKYAGYASGRPGRVLVLAILSPRCGPHSTPFRGICRRSDVLSVKRLMGPHSTPAEQIHQDSLETWVST